MCRMVSQDRTADIMGDGIIDTEEVPAAQCR